EVKIGGTFKSFPIEERFRFGLSDPGLNDPSSDDYNPDLAPFDLTRGGTTFDFHDKRTGTYYGLYARDNVKYKSLTLNLGVRYDHNNLPSSESSWQPRLGAAYYMVAAFAERRRSGPVREHRHRVSGGVQQRE